ncbi:MAG: hypothetical protein NC248_11370 [Bacteroides sp.]|nr:hypothetical protein [Bacteroides sp.]MCM1391048.1 hypothetical protein [Bacteroides sp.]
MRARNQRRMAWSLVAAIYAAAWAGILWLAVTALSGCTRTVYTPVPAVSTEHLDHDREIKTEVKSKVTSSLRERVERDTKVTVNDQGDTLRTDTRLVYMRDRSLERENDSLRRVIDSLSCIRRDSVPVPYPVERKLNRWEQTKQDWGGFAITAVAAIICIAVVWLAKKMRLK